MRHIPQVDDVAPYLAEADALLITSRYEGGPAVAVEALAQGVPVVSTDCSYLLHEVMTVPQAGRIVPSRDPQRAGAGAGRACWTRRAAAASCCAA